MAFSTPAQKPRGEASSTRSTGTRLRLTGRGRHGGRVGTAGSGGSLWGMSAPRVVSVAAGSPADRAGLRAGDELIAIEGSVPRDVIEYRLLVDAADPRVLLRRGRDELEVVVAKEAGSVLGAEVSS